MTVVKPGITLCEASAGTGKTFHIAHTVLRLVADEGVPVDRIVVVTFTRAATSELGDRVRSRLRDALAALDGRPCPDEVLADWLDTCADPVQARGRLRTALVDFDRALISTIHGFCAEMLRRNAFESGAAFDVELVGDARGVIDEVVTDFWTRVVWDCDPAMLPALRAGGIDLKALNHLGERAANPDLAVIPPFEPEPAPDLGPWRQALDALVEVWDHHELSRLLLDDRVMVQRRSAKQPVSFPRGATSGWLSEIDQFLRRPGLRAAVPEGMAMLLPARLAEGTVSGQRTPTHPFLVRLPAYVQVHEDLLPKVARYTRALKHALIAEVRRALPEQSIRNNARSYDDLLRDLRDALRQRERGPVLAEAIRGQYDIALIDEFQDTDPVQWEVFHQVFSSRLVLIGDPKQAIYAFRGADIVTYQAAARLRNQEQPLNTSFRSDGRLVDALNFLFGRVRQPFGAPEPGYRPLSAHRPPSRIDGDRPPVELRWIAREGRRPISATAWRLKEILADDIAAELARGTRIDGRALRPSDCAVLVYANKEAREVQACLRDRGIPSVIRGEASVLASDAVGWLLVALAAVLDPGDTAALRLALCTPLFGRTGDDLAALESDPGRYGEEAAAFRSWGLRWQERGFAGMFRAMLDDAGVLERLLRQGRTRDAADLLHLGELVHDAASRLRLGPSGQHDWLARGGPDLAEEAGRRRLETDGDAVQVVTMHSAKGLEYPLVWCGSLLRGGFVDAMDRDHLVFHDDQGRLALDLGSPEYAAHLEHREAEQLQEALRLVYVALTRARHRLVVYWGVSSSFAPLGYLLHQKPTDPEGELVQAVTQRLGGSDDAKLRGELQALVDAHPGLGLSDVDWTLSAPAPDLRPDPPPAALRSAVVARKPWLDGTWRRSSFTALVRDVDPLAPRPELDRDDPSDPIPEGDVEIALADAGGGAALGTAVHEVYERLDFQDPVGLRPLVEARFAAHGVALDTVEPWCEGILKSVYTPLDGPRLADVPRACRLDELAFTLPVRGGFAPDGQFTVGALARAFDHPDAPPGCAAALRSLGFAPLQGFLVGAIDLVFEHQGRWYVVDYKTNRLGRTVADYARASMARKMLDANYFLQAHLYVVALHRFLRARLAGYDYDTHVGGYRYLFVRGMPQAGVFADRPSRVLIERIDAALRGDR